MSIIAELTVTESPGMLIEHFGKLTAWLAAQLAPIAGDRAGATPANVSWVNSQAQRLLVQNNVRLAEGDAVLIEWPERVGAWLPPPTARFRLHHLPDPASRGLESL